LAHATPGFRNGNALDNRRPTGTAVLSSLRLGLCIALFAALLPGCAVVTVAGAATGAVIGVAGAVVSTGIKVTGKVIEKTIDVVTPGTTASN
jgi:hypothetical protein